LLLFSFFSQLSDSCANWKGKNQIQPCEFSKQTRRIMQQQLKDIADAVVCSCILFMSFFVVPEILLLLESFGVY
jgi:hypothetical protein